jgi:hypothetical protein
MGATGRTMIACVAALAALAVCATSAHAGRLATRAERAALLRATAASEAGQDLRLRVGQGARVTFAPLTLLVRARVLAVRSQVDPAWALLVAADATRSDIRETFLLERARGRWRVRMSASRGSEYEALCGRARPGPAVAIDLGLTAIGGESSCRHERSRTSLVRPMSADELASVRAMVEWREDPETFDRVPGPVQPEVSEVSTASCDWDGGGQYSAPAAGEVARADPRWGRVMVMCTTGSDGFAALVNQTLLLVGRGGASGAFTRVAAHTHTSWSSMGNLCATRAGWPVAAAPRAALDFCTPFPYALRDALR